MDVYIFSLTQALGHSQQVPVVRALRLHPLGKMVPSGAEIAMGLLVVAPMGVVKQLQTTFPLHGILLLQQILVSSKRLLPSLDCYLKNNFFRQDHQIRTISSVRNPSPTLGQKAMMLVHNLLHHNLDSTRKIPSCKTFYLTPIDQMA